MKGEHETAIMRWTERLLRIVEQEFEEEYVDYVPDPITWQLEWPVLIEMACDDTRDMIIKEKAPQKIISKVIVRVQLDLTRNLESNDSWTPDDFLQYVRYNLRSDKAKKENEIKMSKVDTEKN